MADVITRLKLESGEYDNKVKRATQGLMQMENECRKVGGTLAVLEKDQKQYVQSLGEMQTVSTSVRGKIGELSGAFVELRSQYNRLTEEEKKGDFGKALTASLDKLKIRINEAKAELSDINAELNGIGSKSNDGLFGGNMLNGMLQVFGGNIMTKGFDFVTGAVSSMASEIGDCIKQGIELAKQGEGIRIAFERLGRGDILDGLREATHGTVTDLELMKAAVKFNDFKLPVEELGTMLAFAQQKAKDTGQSIDYMVDSIVTGLGRKSLMILDNLGLSAAEIKEKMKDTGDMTKAVGEIIREQMAKAGDYVETAADRAAQANVSLQNKMEELGRKLAPLEEASNQLWTSMKIGILDVVGGPLTDLINKLTEAGRLKNALNNINGDGSNGNTQVQNQLAKLQVAKNAGASQYMLNSMQSGVIEGYNRQINEREQAINDWNSWRRGNRSEGLQQRIGQWRDKYGTDVNAIKAEADAYKAVIAEYRRGAKEILNPIVPQTTTTTTTTTTSTGGTTKKDTIKQASEDVQKAEKDYADAISNAQQMLVENMIKSDEYDKQVLNGQQRLAEAYLKAYNDTEDEQYLSSFRDTAQHIIEMQGVVDKNIEAQKAAEQAARELERSQKKLAEATQKAVEAGTGNDLKSFYQANKSIVANGGKAMQVPIDITYTDSNLQAFIGNIKERLAQSDVGSDLYNALTKQLADANMLGNFISLAVKNGIDVADIDPQTLWSKIFGDGTTAGDYIPDGFWEGLGEQYEKALGKGLDVNTNTGEVKEAKQEDYIAKFVDTAGKLTSGLSQMTSGLRSLGFIVPKEVDQIIGVINGVSQVISGVSTIISVFSTTAETANTTALGLNTAAIGSLILALETNSFTHLIPFMANGGIIPHAANGYYVPGNSYSGDNTMIMANAGELVLSKSQQGNLAAQLDGNTGGSVDLQPYVTGEMVFLGANNHTQRSGQGEIVTTGMLKRMGII